VIILTEYTLQYRIYDRVSQTGPSASVGGYEQRPSLGSFAVILHNPSVTIY